MQAKPLYIFSASRMDATAPSNSPPQRRGESCHPAQHLLPQFCLLVYPPAFPEQRRLKARHVLYPRAGTWSSLLPAVNGALVSRVGSSCPALCSGEPGPVACWAHCFPACTTETPLCSLSRADRTFDFKSCCNTSLDSGRCFLTLRSQHGAPSLSCGLPALRVHAFPSQGTSWHTLSTPSQVG